MALNIQPLSEFLLTYRNRKQLLDLYSRYCKKEKPQQGKVVAVGKARKTTPT
jgi:co-chaperonin GroES (HSP10)